MQQELYDQLIERKAKEVHEQCEKQIAAFKQLHAGLTDKQKQLLAEQPPMQSEKDVQFTMGVMGAMNLLNAIG
jgi:hypothetical protein